METKHAEVMKRLKIAAGNPMPKTREDETRGERSDGRRLPKIQSQETQMEHEKIQVENPRIICLPVENQSQDSQELTHVFQEDTSTPANGPENLLFVGGEGPA